MLQILIADDHALLRKGLREVLDAQDGWHVCGEAADGREAVDLARALQPHVAVVDQLMPTLNGIEATRQIRVASPGTAVLVLTGCSGERMVEESVAAGARAFLLKTCSVDCLLAAVETLGRGESYPAREAARCRPRAAAGSRPAQPAALTSRELEITQLLAEGKTNWCIATILGISVRTVETHRANVMRKLGMQSLVELVHYALRNLIVEPLPPQAAPAVTPVPRALGE